LPPASPTPAPAAIAVGGDVGQPGAWTPERIAKDLSGDVREVRFSVRGKAAKARCVPLLALVQAARPKVDPRVKGHRLAFVAAVRGRDGYTATFSLGELLPEYGRRDVWVALDHDGGPLGPDHAPAEVLVPADEKASRWVRGLASVTVVDTTAAASRTGAPR
jgi:hypothetical protein